MKTNNCTSVTTASYFLALLKAALLMLGAGCMFVTCYRFWLTHPTRLAQFQEGAKDFIVIFSSFLFGKWAYLKLHSKTNDNNDRQNREECPHAGGSAPGGNPN